MPHRALSVAGALCAAVWLLAVPVAPSTSPAFAQSTDPSPRTRPPRPVRTPPKRRRRSTSLPKPSACSSGPAGNPECVWLGRRVVSLLWRDDLDTAFRHLDLYDRFGCPGGHIQATFRCLILHASSIDPKAADSLNGRVQACWINPSQPAPPPPRRPPPRQARRRTASADRSGGVATAARSQRISFNSLCLLS